MICHANVGCTYRHHLSTIRAVMVASSRPNSSKNAIVVAGFALTFAREFNDREAQTLLSLKERFREQLPNFQTVQSVRFSIAGNAVPTALSGGQVHQVTGVLLQDIRRDGTPRWLLRVDGNSIVVNCTEYTSWLEVWQSAREMLLAAAALVSAPDNGVVQVGMQTADRFVYDKRPASEEYSVSEIFRDDCPFLTAQARKSGLFWHVHQGWWSAEEGVADRILHVLNIASVAEASLPDGIVTLIDHQLVRPWADPQTHGALFGLPSGGERAQLDEVFQQMHEGNLSAIRASLTDEKLRAIGLLGAS